MNITSNFFSFSILFNKKLILFIKLFDHYKINLATFSHTFFNFFQTPKPVSTPLASS